MTRADGGNRGDPVAAGRVVGVGTLLGWRGARVSVVEFDGTTALLRDGRGHYSSVTVAELLTARHEQPVAPADDNPDEEAPGNDGPRERDSGDDEFYAQMLAVDEDREAQARAGHVREMLTGFRSGSPGAPAGGEPRPEYAPGTPKSARYQAKAAELGVSVATVRRWAARYLEAGEAGLVDGRGARSRPVLAGLDPRWVDTARAVLDEHTDAATPTKKLVLARVAARVVRDHGPDTVAVPGRSRGYEALEELSRGRGSFGSGKARRSIANRPTTSYGRLRASRPGQFVLLDTTPLDVFAMEPVTARWVRAELTAAMDLYDRAILGLTLSPSTKSVDVAGVLYQTIQPPTRPAHWPAEAAWDWHGLPATVVFPAERTDGPLTAGTAPAGSATDTLSTVTPPLLPETVVVDRGRVYVSAHVTSVCARLGVSVQLARPDTPTDKSPIERFFRTLREGLLAALPGYKGPDVHHRGLDPQGEAFFFLPELEDMIRQWTAAVYHRRPHDGLVDPHAPGVALSPTEMFAHGVARAGYLTLPEDPGLIYQLLPVVWRRIQHYGVDIHTLRYDGPGLNDYRDRRSPWSEHGGRWPIHIHPDDLRYAYFRDPATGTWHTLIWEHAAGLDGPFSSDALDYTRQLATTEDRHGDPAATLARLLESWNLGLADTPAQRRIALRLARHRALPPPETISAPEGDHRADPSNEPTAVMCAVEQELLTPDQVNALGHDPAHVDIDIDVAGDDAGDLVGDGGGVVVAAGDFYAEALEDL